MDINVILFFGHPLSGKGTQAKRHANVHLSTGTQARLKCEGDEHFAQAHGPTMARGGYLPHSVVMGLVREFVSDTEIFPGSTVCLDGIPRDYDQGRELNSFIAQPGRAMGFDIGITLEEALYRAEYRAKIEGRLDDFDPETVKARWHAWATKRRRTLSVIKQLGVKIYEIDGMRSVDEVSGEISGRITTFFRRQKQDDLSSGGKTKTRRMPAREHRH